MVKIEEKAQNIRATTPWAILLLSLLVFGLLAFETAITRRPWCDEAWFANPAYNLAAKGFMGTTVLEPTGHYRHPVGIDRHTYWMVPLSIVLQAGWYRLFGFSLLSMRSLSMLWGLVGLVAWFRIVHALTGDLRAAVAVVFFLAVDFTYTGTAAVGRMDMMSAALGFSALAVYLSFRDRNLAIAVLLAETLVVAAGLTHPIGGILAFVGLLFLGLWLDWRRLRLTDLVLAVLPYVVGATGWGMYIARDPSNFLTQFSSNSEGRFGELFRPWIAVRHEIINRYLTYFSLEPQSSGSARIKGLVLITYLAGFVAAISSKHIRTHRRTRTLLILAGIYVSGLAIFDCTRQQYYLVYSIAPLCMIWGLWFSNAWAQRWLPTFGLVAAACALLATQVGVQIHRIRDLNTMKKSYLPAVTFLREHVPDDKLLMGSAELGFELGFERNLTDDPTLGYYTGKRADYVVVETLNYDQFFKAYQQHEPAIYRHVTGLLGLEYRLVYDRAQYRIYTRR